MQVRLLVDNGVAGQNRFVNLPLTYSEPRMGGVSDNWGRTWTVGDISQSGFGVRVTADVSGTGANLDYVTVTVYLQDPSDDSDHDGQANSADPDDDGDGAGDENDNCPTVSNADQRNTDLPQLPNGDAMGDACEHDDDNDTAPDGYDLCPLIYNFGQDDTDGDALGNECDNFPSVSNADQTDTDGDGQGDACDIDDDADGFRDTIEISCGSNSLMVGSVPERLDAVFDDVDDDGDTAIDEMLPAGSGDYDCDGDGWTGNQEKLVFDDAPLTWRDQDACGNNGWPADLDPNNKLNIGDINSFTTPARAMNDGHGTFNKFGHPLDDDGNGSIDGVMARWNLDMPPHDPTAVIDIGDINAINPGVNAPTARPPMFGGQPAFFTDPDGPSGPKILGECLWEPGDGPEPDLPIPGGDGAIDDISIDMGALGPVDAVLGNGKPAAGDRNSDSIPDAEGTLEGICPIAGGANDTQDDDGDTVVNDGCPGTGIAASGTPEMGLCGNGVDDDPYRAPTPPLIRYDGVADDGCVVPLTPAESCAAVIVDGVQNAGEDLGADLLSVDVTVGLPAMTGSGIPAERPMTAFQLSLNWDNDLIDVLSHDPAFLIHAAGARTPFSSIASPDPAVSPFTVAVADGGPAESGAGVLARLLIEGKTAGLANLSLSEVSIKDAQNTAVPIGAINGARIAVSKDLDGDGVIEAAGDQGRELYTCAA